METSSYFELGYHTTSTIYQFMKNWWLAAVAADEIYYIRTVESVQM